MARPTTHPKRDRQLNIALRNNELAELQGRADAQGIRLVDYARAALLNMLVASHAPPFPSRLDRLNHEQLKRIGNNLNQIARQLNLGGQVAPPDLEDSLRQLRLLISNVGHDDP